MLNFYNPLLSTTLDCCSSDEAHRRRVNLLDFPKFDGVRGLDRVSGSTERLPFPFLADLRYVYRTPLPHKYPPVRRETLDSQRLAAFFTPRICQQPTRIAEFNQRSLISRKHQNARLKPSQSRRGCFSTRFTLHIRACGVDFSDMRCLKCFGA